MNTEGNDGINSASKIQSIKTSAKLAWKSYQEQRIRVVAYRKWSTQKQEPYVSSNCRDPKVKMTDQFITKEVDDNSFFLLAMLLGKQSSNLEALSFRSREHFEAWHAVFFAMTQKRLYLNEQKTTEVHEKIINGAKKLESTRVQFLVLYRCNSPLTKQCDTLATSASDEPDIVRLGEGMHIVLPRPSDGIYLDTPMIINEGITQFECDLMVRIAISFNKNLNYDHRYIQDKQDVVDLREVLLRSNWRKKEIPGEIEYWSRPGEKGVSACVYGIEGADVFTNLDRIGPFAYRKSYSATQVFSLLEHSGSLEITGEVIGNFIKQMGGPNPFGKIALGPKEEQENGVPIDPSYITFFNATGWLKKKLSRPEPIIAGILDIEDKCVIIGQSKIRKSYFVIQLGIGIAAGRDTLGFSIPKPRKVAIANLEIKPGNFQDRLNDMINAFDGSDSKITENLFVANLWGIAATLESIGEAIQSIKPEVLIIDPLYKLYPKGHNENSAGDTAGLMAGIEKLAKQSKCAIIIVHHDSKSGNEDLRVARGAGSGLLSRDFDSAIYLTAHAKEKDAVVVGHILRNYPPREDIAIRWADNSFVLDNTLPALESTYASRRADRQRGMSEEEVIKKVETWFIDRMMANSELQRRIREECNKGKNAASGIVTLMCDKYGYKRIKQNGINMLLAPGSEELEASSGV